MKREIQDLKDTRILFVSSIIPPEHSGAGKRIYNFYKFLKSENIDTGVLTNTNDRGIDAEIMYIKSITFEGYFRKLSIFINFVSYFFQLLILAPGFNPNNKKKGVVWLTSARPLTFAASIVFKILGYKIITQNTLVGSDDPEFKYPGDVLGIKYGLKRLQYYLSDAVTSISPALYNLSKNYHSNTVMIPNPVDTTKFSNNLTAEERQKRKKVLIVGKIGYRKGSDIVLRTIELVHEVDPEVEFTFVGPHDDLKEICEKEGIDLKKIMRGKVNFEGYVQDPTPYYKNSSILFLPSRREGFGTVFIEAMAAGLPVVCLKLEGITDFIFGRNYIGVLNESNEKEFFKIISLILDDINTFNKIISISSNNFKRFDLHRIYNNYSGLLKSLE